MSKHWVGADSRHVLIQTMWDNVHMHTPDLGVPMYKLWNNSESYVLCIIPGTMGRERVRREIGERDYALISRYEIVSINIKSNLAHIL